ncbi:MAG: hypothetical protein EOP10_32530, partial [Proteobacteria bacterium]
LKGVIFARENAAEVQTLMSVTKQHAEDFRCESFESLEGVLAFIFEGVVERNRDVLEPIKPSEYFEDFSDMTLNEGLKEIALCFAVGRHSLLLRGSPGSGKSMFASRLPSLLPSELCKHA